MKIVMLGIDLGKNVCSLAGLDETGAVVLRRRMKRGSVLPFTAQLERCTVAQAEARSEERLGSAVVIPAANSLRMPPSLPRASARSRAMTCPLCGGRRRWRLRWPRGRWLRWLGRRHEGKVPASDTQSL